MLIAALDLIVSIPPTIAALLATSEARPSGADVNFIFSQKKTQLRVFPEALLPKSTSGAVFM
jgi:hypothetical protein